MLLVALSSIVASATVALSLLHLRAVSRALTPSAASLVPALLRTELADRDRKLASLVPRESWEGQLADALFTATSPALRAAAANEALGDLELLFSSRARWAPSAIRIALLGGLLFGALALIRADWMLSIVVVGLSAVAAGACATISSKTRATEKLLRKQADALIDALIPGLPRVESVGRRFKDVL